jgi:Spy/CpxP family protein refolding chaperone
MRSWKFKLGIVAVFALGVVVGAVAAGTYLRMRAFDFSYSHPDQAVGHIMKRLDRELNLSDNQRKKIEPIVLDSFTKMRAMRYRLTPEVEALVDQTAMQIKQHLDPEQQRKLDAHNAEVMKRWRMFAGPGVSPPSGPPPGK